MLAVSVACALAAPAVAQDTDSIAPYVLGVPATVRGFALNDAGVALVGDAGAVFANPAALATLSHIGLEGSYRRAPGAAYLASAAIGWRIRQFDLALGGRFFDFGSDPSQYFGTVIPPDTWSREAMGVGSLVYRYGLIALGVSGKYARRSFAGEHNRGFSGDAGLAIALFDIMAFAFSMQNIGGNWRSDATLEMPRLARLGFTMNYVDPQESFRLLSTVEVQWPEEASTRAVIGVEAGVVVQGVGVIGRVAYGGGTATIPDRGFTMGGSLRFGALTVDYAYRKRDLLDESAHLIGARFTL